MRAVFLETPAKIDVKTLGASASSSLSQDTTRRENTVYAFFIQQLFSVRADMRGERPIHALFNNSFTVADLEKTIP
ncbi:hypothetical protein [Archangium lipolyticum]|uniref:hypothetical protein n=1 Tax=Archangium lipolyticum TaxID=2970465 RepID=UPI00214A2F6D|nr:hypothetical protein [Archangium lipolyticum]